MNRQRAILLLLAASVPAACARVGAPMDPASPHADEDVRPPAEAAHETFTGYATLTGHRLPVSLALTGVPGRDLAAELDAPDMKLEAVGKGKWDGDVLTLELTYGETCAGSMRVRLQRDDMGRLHGSLVARDCTGRAEGPVDLAPSRRPGRETALR